LIIVSVLLVSALGFGGWAFAQMLDYKNNVDAKVATAVDAAKAQEDQAKDAAFAEQEKSPLRTYTGPSAYGSVKIQYPKTWSAYVADGRNSSPFIDAYFYPGAVPDIQSQNSVFALRVQLVQDSYSSVINSLAGYIHQGKTTVRPYKSAKVPSVIGARIEGALPNNKSGSMVVIPLRNMTLKIWTEAPQFKADFDKYILPNYSFAP
jgi:hypothetical protein